MTSIERQYQNEIDELRAERDALIVRREELLRAMVRITNETPFADEANQVPTLIAKVGTLRTERDAADRSDVAARGEILRMRVTIETLKVMLGKACGEIVVHNGDYDHVTSAEQLAAWIKAIEP